MAFWSLVCGLRLDGLRLSEQVFGQVVGQQQGVELGRELGSQTGAMDAVGRLTRTGLVHRWGEFVFPSRTTTRAAAMQIGTV